MLIGLICEIYDRRGFVYGEEVEVEFFRSWRLWEERWMRLARACWDVYVCTAKMEGGEDGTAGREEMIRWWGIWNVWGGGGNRYGVIRVLRILRAIMRPLELLFRHPVCFMLRLSMAVVYDIFYLILVIMMVEFQGRYRWEDDVSDSIYIRVGLATTVALLASEEISWYSISRSGSQSLLRLFA